MAKPAFLARNSAFSSQVHPQTRRQETGKAKANGQRLPCQTTRTSDIASPPARRKIPVRASSVPVSIQLQESWDSFIVNRFSGDLGLSFFFFPSELSEHGAKEDNSHNTRSCVQPALILAAGYNFDVAKQTCRQAFEHKHASVEALHGRGVG